MTATLDKGHLIEDSSSNRRGRKATFQLNLQISMGYLNVLEGIMGCYQEIIDSQFNVDDSSGRLEERDLTLDMSAGAAWKPDPTLCWDLGIGSHDVTFEDGQLKFIIPFKLPVSKIFPSGSSSPSQKEQTAMARSSSTPKASDEEQVRSSPRVNLGTRTTDAIPHVVPEKYQKPRYENCRLGKVAPRPMFLEVPIPDRTGVCYLKCELSRGDLTTVVYEYVRKIFSCRYPSGLGGYRQASSVKIVPKSALFSCTTAAELKEITGLTSRHNVMVASWCGEENAFVAVWQDDNGFWQPECASHLNNGNVQMVSFPNDPELDVVD